MGVVGVEVGEEEEVEVVVVDVVEEGISIGSTNTASNVCSSRPKG